jgi:hypothetical protein
VSSEEVDSLETLWEDGLESMQSEFSEATGEGTGKASVAILKGESTGWMSAIVSTSSGDATRSASGAGGNCAGLFCTLPACPSEYPSAVGEGDSDSTCPDGLVGRA